MTARRKKHRKRSQTPTSSEQTPKLKALVPPPGWQPKELPQRIKPLARDVDAELAAIKARMEKRMAERRAAGEITGTESPEPTQAERRRIRWKAICPPTFQTTELRLLPCTAESIRLAQSFPIARKSVRFVGVTGTGKTRLAWVLLEKEYLRGARILALDAGEFGSAASGAYREGKEEEFFWRLMRPQILFLDDIGKARITQRVAEALFTVFDRRLNRDRPILATMNYTLETFRSKLEREEVDRETIMALNRRMAEGMAKVAITR